MDCTLYSYMELALSQRGLCFSLLKSALAKDSRSLYNHVDKVCNKYSEDIGKRVQFISDLFGTEQVLIYSSYPLTETKQKLIASFSVKFHSSFPHRKTAKEVRSLVDSKVSLVIGDRKEDKELSLELNALWSGFPYYDFRHLLSGSSYTKAFSCLVKRACKKAENSEKPTYGEKKNEKIKSANKK